MIRHVLVRALLLAAATLLVMAGWRIDIASAPPTASATVPLSRSRPLSEGFDAAYATLSGVDVLVERPGGPAELVLELRGENQALERAASARLAEPGRTWAVFRFPDIRGSSGRRYTFRLEAPDTVYRDGLLVWRSEQPRAGRREGPSDAQERDPMIVYRAHYRPSVAELLVVYIDRVAQAHSGVLGRPAIYGALVLAYVVAIAALAALASHWGLLRARDGDG